MLQTSNWLQTSLFQVSWPTHSGVDDDVKIRFEGGEVIRVEIFSMGLVMGFFACLQQAIGELMVLCR